MMSRTIVVGSGAGGAAVARELAGKQEVIVLERGPAYGRGSALRHYDILKTGEVDILQASCTGGSTSVSLANIARSTLADFRSVGLDLREEFDAISTELGSTPFPVEGLGPVSSALMEAMGASGLDVKPMPKAIDLSKCDMRGGCERGCDTGAKWDSRVLLDDAIKKGARLLTGFRVDRVRTEDGAVTGIVGTEDGRRAEMDAEEIVLCAGAIQTPQILLRSGVDCGRGLFVDPFVTVGGVVGRGDQRSEVPMPLYFKGEGYIISPFYSQLLVQSLREMGVRARPQELAGLMVKVGDRCEGGVTVDGVEKTLTREDRRALDEGIALAGEVLTSMGARDVAVTGIMAAHPGGSFPLASSDVSLDVEGLYVSDASRIPGGDGNPHVRFPILGVLALSRAVATRILDRA